MITIERTLTNEEQRALTIIGKTEQEIANRLLESLNITIASVLSNAKQTVVKDKNLTDIEFKLKEMT